MRHRLVPALPATTHRGTAPGATVLRLAAVGVLAAVLWALAAVAAAAGPAPLVPAARCTLAAPQHAPVGGGMRSGAGQRACAPDTGPVVATTGPDRDRDPLQDGLPAGSADTAPPVSWDEGPVIQDRPAGAPTVHGSGGGRAPPDGGTR